MAFINIRSKSIPERALFNYTGGGGSIAISSEGGSIPDVEMLGADCLALTPVYIGSDGRLYKASCMSDIAEFLTAQDGLEGDYVRVLRNMQLESFTDNDLYLGIGELVEFADMPENPKYFQRIVKNGVKYDFIELTEYYEYE